MPSTDTETRNLTERTRAFRPQNRQVVPGLWFRGLLIVRWELVLCIWEASGKQFEVLGGSFFGPLLGLVEPFEGLLGASGGRGFEIKVLRSFWILSSARHGAL